MELHTDLFNFADDAEDELDRRQRPDFFAQAVLYGTDWTVKTVLQQIEDGNIDLSPDFQRRDAWSSKNKSRFIESVALQIPIPQIVLAERKERRGTYIVLDGKQRLLTLAQFAANLDDDHPVVQQSKEAPPLRLTGLKVLDQLNGKAYTDLANDPSLGTIKTQFDNHTVRSALIRNWPNEDYLYEVFIRLNTGSAKLSPQELRQAMKPGSFTDFLSIKSSESRILQAVLGIDGPDFRMRDVDLLLRMIAYSYRFDAYQGNLKAFLDDTHDLLNAEWDQRGDSITELTFQIESALEFLTSKFGNPLEVGRRWINDKFESAVNRAILDVQLACALGEHNRKIIDDAKVDLRRLTIDLCLYDRDFVEAVSGTTKSMSALRARFWKWRAALEDVAKAEIVMPKVR